MFNPANLPYAICFWSLMIVAAIDCVNQGCDPETYSRRRYIASKMMTPWTSPRKISEKVMDKRSSDKDENTMAVCVQLLSAELTQYRQAKLFRIMAIVVITLLLNNPIALLIPAMYFFTECLAYADCTLSMDNSLHCIAEKFSGVMWGIIFFLTACGTNHICGVT